METTRWVASLAVLALLVAGVAPAAAASSSPALNGPACGAHSLAGTAPRAVTSFPQLVTTRRDSGTVARGDWVVVQFPNARADSCSGPRPQFPGTDLAYATPGDHGANSSQTVAVAIEHPLTNLRSLTVTYDNRLAAPTPTGLLTPGNVEYAGVDVDRDGRIERDLIANLSYVAIPATGTYQFAVNGSPDIPAHSYFIFRFDGVRNPVRWDGTDVTATVVGNRTVTQTGHISFGDRYGGPFGSTMSLNLPPGRNESPLLTLRQTKQTVLNHGILLYIPTAGFGPVPNVTTQVVSPDRVGLAVNLTNRNATVDSIHTANDGSSVDIHGTASVAPATTLHVRVQTDRWLIERPVPVDRNGDWGLTVRAGEGLAPNDLALDQSAPVRVTVYDDNGTVLTSRTA